jgi:arginase family enzyme
LLVGSIEIQDLIVECAQKDPSVQAQRKVLIDSLRKLDERSRSVVKTIFDSKKKLFYMNGDHNNMGYVIGGFYESKKQKPIVIYLDVHSDARVKEDGPHSGTWLDEVFTRGECEKAYLVGLSLVANNEQSISNLEKHKVEFLPYTWDRIQSEQPKKSLLNISKDIVKEI